MLSNIPEIGKEDFTTIDWFTIKQEARIVNLTTETAVQYRTTDGHIMRIEDYDSELVGDEAIGVDLGLVIGIPDEASFNI